MVTEKSKQQNKDKKNCKTLFREISRGCLEVERVFPDGTSGTFRIARSDLSKYPTKTLLYCVLTTALEIINNNKDKETQEPLTAENFQERLNNFRELDISKFLNKYRCKQKRLAKNKMEEKDKKPMAENDELEAKLYKLEAQIHELKATLTSPSTFTH